MYKLSPSDFAFLYEECKYCYCLKIKQGIFQPSMPMPGVFSAINTRIQGSLISHNLQKLSPDLPDGIAAIQEGWVDSVIIPGTIVYIKGKYDLLVKNPDGTYTLVDLKISQPAEDKIDKYRTQLSAYKYALEHPKNGDSLPITRMGLLIFYPDTISFEKGVARLDFPPKWLEVTYDEGGFLSFIQSIEALLAGPLPPEGPDCKWCQYRHVSTETVKAGIGTTEAVPFL